MIGACSYTISDSILIAESNIPLDFTYTAYFKSYERSKLKSGVIFYVNLSQFYSFCAYFANFSPVFSNSLVMHSTQCSDEHFKIYN